MTFTANEDTTVDVYFTKESYDNNTPNDTISLIANQEKTTTYDRENIYKFKLPYTSSPSAPWISYVYNIKYLKIEGELLDCSKLFYRCLSLINLDTTKFDTSKVTDMSNMFSLCYLLTTVKVINCSSDTQNKILSQLQSDMSSNNGLVKYDWVLENGVITRKEKQ